jgi:CDP-diacylglycerol--glycerol-3-phosphate 3-phosphatidyltransferase
MHSKAYHIINAITWYRVVMVPVLVTLLIFDRIDIFKWLLPVSFFTDFIDGFLARKYKVASVFGARLDSIGDDLTVAAGVAGIIVWKPAFMLDQLIPLGILLGLFIIQLIIAFTRFGKATSFHTYLAKLAALAQGCFLILFFFYPGMGLSLFYTAVIITLLDLVEEIILALIIDKWTTNIHGLFWYFAGRKKDSLPEQHHDKS